MQTIILKALKINCRKIEQEEFQSIDEQIVPAKTKFSGIRQYNPKKPKKWGFKNFVRAGGSGFMHDFFFHAGAKSAGITTCGAADVVKKLCETMPSNLNHKLFFDNWFCTLQLCLDLKADGILTAATLRKDTLAGCKLLSDTELKQKDRGRSEHWP